MSESSRNSAIMTYRCAPSLIKAAEAAAAAEGISTSDVARRALLRDLRLSPRPQEARQ